MASNPGDAGYDLLPGDREDVTTCLRTELIYLWGELAAAYRYSQASPPEKSMGFGSLVERIRRVTGVVGPVSGEHVECWFLELGMYERLHAEMGYPQGGPPPRCCSFTRTGG